MNILFVSNNSREATILAFELTKNIPSVKIRTAYDTQDALKDLHESGGVEAIIFDSSVSRSDCSILMDTARQSNRHARILFLLEPDTKEIPRPLNDLGIDRFVPKRPGYGAILAESLQPAPEASRPETAKVETATAGGKAVKKIRVLYAGREAAELAPHLAATPNLTMVQIPATADGTLKLPERGDTPFGDLIVIDSDVTGAQTLNAIKDAALKAPDVPVIVLTSAEDEDLAERAVRAGAFVCVVKSGNYFKKLIPVIGKEILVRDLAREKEIFKTRGSRLRQIVESLPVGVAQIAPSGTILAINQAGLRILGANNLNQVAGKNLLQLAPPDEREKILAFLSTVTGWAGASIRIAWKGLNGSSASLELRGTPLLRDPGGSACVLTTIHLTSSVVASPGKNEDLQQKCDALTQSLKVYEAQFKDLQQKFTAAEERCRTLDATRQDDGKAANAELQSAYQELEEKLQAAEVSKDNLEARLKEKDEQLTASEEALEQAEARLTQKEEELRAEYEQKLFVAKEEHNTLVRDLATADSEKSRHSEEQDAERSKWETLKAELEHRAWAAEEQAVSLQGELDKAEEQSASLQGELEKVEEALRLAAEQTAAADESERWGVEKKELEEKLQAVEKERNTLAASLTSTDSNRKRRAEDWAVEQAKYEKRLAELERRCKNAEESRGTTESERDSLRDELKRFQERLDAAEAQSLVAQTALQDTEKRLAELSVRQIPELGDGGRADLEVKYHAAEEQSVTLQSALKETEGRLAALIEKYNNERSDQQKTQRDLELRLQTAEAQKNAVQAALQDSIEKQHTALTDALRSTESNVSQLTEKYMEEIAHLETLQQQTEQKFQVTEQLQIRLQGDLKAAEVRIEELTQKYTTAEEARATLEREQEEARSTAAESTDSNMRCQRLSKYTSVGVALANRDGFVLECNDIAARMFGYESAEAALSQTGTGRFRLYAFTGLLGKRLEAEGKLENIGWTFQDGNGRLIQIQEYATLVDNSGGDLTVERILMDISQSHLRGEEIRHLRKLESTGDLAIATIKSFQDLCTSLAQSSELLLEVGGDKEVKKLAESIRLKASRGIKYANRFIAASRKTEKAPTLLNFNEVITGNDTLLHNLTGEDIDVQMTLEPQLGWIAVEQSEVLQLVSNVMTTAREALPLGGIVAIETTNIETAEGGEDEPADLPSGTYVRVNFSIDGVAAQPERRNASIRATVDRMGGWLTFGNDPKKGNVFSVFLPRVEVFSVR